VAGPIGREKGAMRKESCTIGPGFGLSSIPYAPLDFIFLLDKPSNVSYFV
jgi:hypothetical protein